MVHYCVDFAYLLLIAPCQVGFKQARLGLDEILLGKGMKKVWSGTKKQLKVTVAKCLGLTFATIHSRVVNMPLLSIAFKAAYWQSWFIRTLLGFNHRCLAVSIRMMKDKVVGTTHAKNYHQLHTIYG